MVQMLKVHRKLCGFSWEDFHMLCKMGWGWLFDAVINPCFRYITLYCIHFFFVSWAKAVFYSGITKKSLKKNINNRKKNWTKWQRDRCKRDMPVLSIRVDYLASLVQSLCPWLNITFPISMYQITHYTEWKSICKFPHTESSNICS